MKKIYKSRKDKIIGGVCGGIAEYFEIDPVIIRVLFVFLTLFHGSGLILYLLLLIILPNEPLPFTVETSEQEVKTEEQSESTGLTYESKNNKRRIFGIILLIIGLILLLENTISFLDLEFAFPIILILIGVYFIYDSLKMKR